VYPSNPSNFPEFPTPVLDNPYYGISEEAFSEEIQKKLSIPIEKNDVEIKPEYLIFLNKVEYYFYLK
jgi:hypothetical protein